MLDIFRNCKSYGDIDKNILDANSKATSEWYDKLRKTVFKAHDGTPQTIEKYWPNVNKAILNGQLATNILTF